MPPLKPPEILLAKLIVSSQLLGALKNQRRKFARQLEQTP